MTQAEFIPIDPMLMRHGGRIDDAMRAFPGAAQPWIDLSTGINPLPWMPPANLAVDAGPLPPRSALAALEQAAAGYFGVASERVAAVPGSEVALRLIPALGLPRPIIAMDPCYGTHRDVADRVVPFVVPIRTAPGTTLLFASPNNPDGRTVPLSALAAHDGWAVVDEAFADATPHASILPHITENQPILVMRSFGKFFGLAGLRLGFVVGPPAPLAALRGLLGDWPVSAHAIAWGCAAYADCVWIARTRRALVARAARLDALLAKHGLTARGDCPLFRLVVDVDAGAIFNRLARAGILTRPFADRADWLRLGLPGDDAAFARLDRALADG